MVDGAGSRRRNRPPQDLSRAEALQGCSSIDFEGAQRLSIGRVALLGQLGRGGMGVVYYGVNPRLGTEVAVKVLRATKGQLQRRFVQEARLTAQLESPHLVRVLDVDQDEHSGTHYMVMEYVHGTNARQWAADALTGGKRTSEADALAVCIAAAKGLEVAHTEGILHRDIKPANILIPTDNSEEPLFEKSKLADLGLARIERAVHSHTGSDHGMGTPGYVSPEQARDARGVGKQTDVFGAGATLYALLTGRAPFFGSTAVQALAKTLEGKYTPVREFRPNVSRATETLINRCLSPDPADRFPDASALREALEVCRDAHGKGRGAMNAAEVVDGLVHARERGKRVVATEPMARRRVRRKKPFPVAPLVAVAILAAAAWFLFLRDKVAPPGLSITSTPSGATVLVDGEKKGVTPLFIADLEGEHEVVLTIRGLRVRTEQVDIGSGERKELDLTIGSGVALDVKSTPRGVVSVDGKEYGPTPQLLTDLEPGTHAVRIQARFHVAFAEQVNLATIRSIDATLKRSRVNVTFTGPAGATVVLERPGTTFEATLGAAGRATERIEAGEYTLKATHPFHKPFEIELVAEKDLEFPLAMPELKALLTVASTPTGADVLLDDALLGKTPLTREPVAPGEHRLTVRCDGHEPFKKNVTFERGRVEDLKHIPLKALGKLDLSALRKDVSARLGNRPVRHGQEIPSGTHVIELRRETYATQNVEVTVAPGQTVKVVPYAWERYQAVLLLNAPHKDARVFLNDRNQTGAKRTWASDRNIPVRVVRPGFKEVTLTVVLRVGEKRDVSTIPIDWVEVITKLDLSDYPPGTKLKLGRKWLSDGSEVPIGPHEVQFRGSKRKLTLEVVSQTFVRPPLPKLEDEPIRRALGWLARHQSAGWECKGFLKHCKDVQCGPPGVSAYDQGVTALAVLAFLAAGETGEPVKKGLDYLLGRQQRDGRFNYQGNAHNHACATLALTEAYRLTGNRKLKEPAERALSWIVKRRHAREGWGDAGSPRSNLSVTGWVLRALKSAELAGLEVDQPAYGEARAWIKTMRDSVSGRFGWDVRDGTSWRPKDRRELFPTKNTAAMTAVGIVCLSDDVRPNSVELCLKRLPAWKDKHVDMYYWYYGTLAMYRLGGESWKTWNAALRNAALMNQHKAGGRAGAWNPDGVWGKEGGCVYATALMCLSLTPGYRADSLVR